MMPDVGQTPYLPEISLSTQPFGDDRKKQMLKKKLTYEDEETCHVFFQVAITPEKNMERR